MKHVEWFTVADVMHHVATPRVASDRRNQAFFRRATAKQKLGDLDSAYEDLKEAAQMPGRPKSQGVGQSRCGAWVVGWLRVMVHG